MEITNNKTRIKSEGQRGYLAHKDERLGKLMNELQ